MVRILTSKGPLEVQLYPQIATSALFSELVESNAYANCHFSNPTKDYVQLSKPSASLGVLKHLSHTLVKFGKRGTVAVLDDYSVIITTGTEAIDLDCTIVGVLTNDSFWLIQEIIESKKYPVSIIDPAKETVEEVPKANAKKNPKKRQIMMFDTTIDAPRAKFKPNPKIGKEENPDQVPPADTIFQKLQEFEKYLDQRAKS